MTKSRKRLFLGIGGVLLAYALLVAAFELSIGLRQPESSDTLVIHTIQDDGSEHRRVLARLQDDGRLYVAVNHWPRAWYRQALANPEVRVTVDGAIGNYRAVPVAAAEHQQLQQRFPLSTGTRVMTGFPPRYFLRLEPR